MVDSIWISEQKNLNSFQKLEFESVLFNKIEIGKSLKFSANSILKIRFKHKIRTYRSHDYTWKKLDTIYNSNPFCPKVIVLENNFYVQPNFNIGIWELNSLNPYELIWHFNPHFAAPIVSYNNQNLKEIASANFVNANLSKLSILFSNINAFEVSRSRVSFSAVACFTDHCDFDTLENLRLQREFFKKFKIITTKGFFLNHFSKRADNASFQDHAEEIQKWRTDGHELVYHSLTQSIRNFEDAIDEFKDFTPPFKINTWIDHGFQPYNFTLFDKSKFSTEEYENVLKEKGINYLWNYLDSGTATFGVLNQLNTSQFTLSHYLKGIKSFSFQTRINLFLKLLLMHYFNKPAYQKMYKDAASNFKKVRYHKEFKNVLGLIGALLSLSMIGFKIVLNWNKVKNTPFEHAKYAPILFKHTIKSEVFTVFQTLELVDFTNSLKKQSLDTFISEKGFFIAHTYFSVPMAYHKGRLIVNDKINPEVEQNFKYLSEQIKLGKLWNPTLKDLASFLNNFEEVEFDINTNGEIFCNAAYNYNLRILTNDTSTKQ